MATKKQTERVAGLSPPQAKQIPGRSKMGKWDLIKAIRKRG